MYPPDVAPGFWKQVAELIAAGRLVSPDIVRDELLRVGDDGLADWLGQYPGLFRDLDDALQLAVGAVVDALPNFVQSEATLTRADPFVVALARLTGGVVVAAEKPSKSPGTHTKVPDACAHFSVRCLRLHDFMRESGIRL